MMVAIWCDNMEAAMNTMADCPISSKFVFAIVNHGIDARAVWVIYRVTEEQATMIHKWGVQQRPALHMKEERKRR